MDGKKEKHIANGYNLKWICDTSVYLEFKLTFVDTFPWELTSQDPNLLIFFS